MPTPIEKLPEIRTANQSLIDAFAVHPGLPAQARALKGKLFCLWDFANRTNAMIESVLNNTVPPDTPGMRGKVPQVPTGEMTEAQRSSLVEDAVSRCLMVKMMMDNPAMFAPMFQDTPGEESDVGEQVKKAAENLANLITEIS